MTREPGARLVGLAKRLLKPWMDFWQRTEGPELEPAIWHSHFLCGHVMNSGFRAICHGLSGLVLDVGAGTGFAGRFLDPARTRYIPTDLPTGRDPSDTVVTQAGEKPKLFCSGYALPVRDCSVNAVMVHSVLEHVHDPWAILAEAFRVLVPEGRLVVSVPFCFPVHGAPDDYWRWTPEGLRLEIERAGFAVDDVVSMGNGVHALALNLNLLFRYQIGSGSRLRSGLEAVLRPLRLVIQLVTNLFALLLGRLNRSDVLPVAIGLVAVKPAPRVVDHRVLQDGSSA